MITAPAYASGRGSGRLEDTIKATVAPQAAGSLRLVATKGRSMKRRPPKGKEQVVFMVVGLLLG
jgi:hypothetical protein